MRLVYHVCVCFSDSCFFDAYTFVSVGRRMIDGNTCAAACHKRLYSSTGDLYAPSTAPEGGTVLRNKGRMHSAHELGTALEPSQARAAAVGGQGIARSCGQGPGMLLQMRAMTPAAAQEATRVSARDWMCKQVLDIVGLVDDSSATDNVTDKALGLPPPPSLHACTVSPCFSVSRERANCICAP